jgi:hypothetical protein
MSGAEWRALAAITVVAMLAVSVLTEPEPAPAWPIVCEPTMPEDLGR